MNSSHSPLGRSTSYPQQYSPKSLHAIARTESRSDFIKQDELPFHGVDFWNAWDMSWLATGGQPCNATLHISIAAESISLVESKSLKLYLGSFAMSEFSSSDQVAKTITSDLSSCVSGDVSVVLRTMQQSAQRTSAVFDGVNLDDLNIECDRWNVDADLLLAEPSSIVEQTFFTHSLRSLCPVTAQPDCGSLQIRYCGPRIDAESLLRYVVSYRTHNDFHEACVERIFVDLAQRCGCRQLSVYARYQRRGGIDINPFRSNFEAAPENERLWRQ